MKSWFGALQIGALSLFLLVSGGAMFLQGFVRGEEWVEFRLNGRAVKGRVVSTTKSKVFLVKSVHRATVEFPHREWVRRATIDIYKEEFRKLRTGASIELFVSRRDPRRVRPASHFKNKPLSIGGLSYDPIGFFGLLNLGIGGYLSWRMIAPWLDTIRTKGRRKAKVARGRTAATVAPRPRLVVDRSAGLSGGTELLPLVNDRNWTELSARVASSDRSLVRTIDELVEAEAFPGWLDEWAAADPRNAVPWLMRGIRGVSWAWEARGSGRAEDVDPKAWPVFYERLENAESDLAVAAALDPSDARPWIRLITVAKALSMPLPERHALFEEATRRAPHSFDAHLMYLDAIAEKWGGSHRASLAHARRIASEAPASSGLASLLADVHFEIAAASESMEGYFERPEIREELRRAAETCGAVRLPWLRRRAAANFAFCFWQAGLLEEAKQQFTRSEGYVCGIWSNYPDPAAHYERAWRECA